jgi:calreticulin
MRMPIILSLFLLASATVYFSDDFSEDWHGRWIQPPVSDLGRLEWAAGRWYADEFPERGIRTVSESKHFMLATTFKPFTNKDKTLVVQYTVKNEQNLNCGGSYIKVFAEGFEPAKFTRDMNALVMFGPDKCGSEKRTHLMLSYKNKGVLNKIQLPYRDDPLTHVYTFVLRPDNTFKVLIDFEVVADAHLEDYFDMLPPKELVDTNARKPADWEEQATIVDVGDRKPSNWDVPEFIADDTAEKPDDWDEAEDGKWLRPKKKNPEFRGDWAPRIISNPKYKGPWTPPVYKNPAYQKDDNLYQLGTFGGVGFEVLQVNPGSIFDNFFIGDDENEAREYEEKTSGKRRRTEPDLLNQIRRRMESENQGGRGGEL